MAKTKKPTVILLDNVADVIKYFQGEIPDWESLKFKYSGDDLRVTKELYLKAIELMENAKHIY